MIAPPHSRNAARLVVAFIVAFDIAAFWQWMNGAFQSEFGGHPDEGAHYVAGLATRDSMGDVQKNRNPAPGAAKSDVGDKFGERMLGGSLPAYHAFWPPGFSVVQSSWTFAFGTSRLSMLLLVAAFAAGVATMLYGAVREEFGEWGAIAAALLWLCAGLVRETYGMLMPEMLGTFAIFGATLAWGRFLDRGHAGDAIPFGILASVALWTEGAGVVAVLSAGVSLVLTRHWRRLAKWELWLMSLFPVLSIFCVRKLLNFERFDFSTRSLAQAAPFYAGQLAFSVGLAVAVFAVAGVCFRCVSRGERQGRWVAIASMVVSVFAYHCARSEHLEARHVIAAAPGLIMLAMAGARSISGLTSARVADAMERRRRESLWILLLVLLALPFEVLRTQPKEFGGFGTIARTLIAEAPRDARILISSDATGEGMFISEVAMNDRRTGFTIETASTSLAKPREHTNDPRNSRERFAEDGDLLKYLTSGRIQYVVLDDALPFRERAGYHDQIRRILEDNVRSFWPILEIPITRGGETLGRPAKLYRVIRDR